tara:strand:+ start:173 stop:2749 length:2577 start_codon:yes stop_codon:yes gene_type:complete
VVVSFSSWYRQGIIAPVSEDLSSDPAASSEAWIELEEVPGRYSHQFSLLGPGGVSGLSPEAFVRKIPENGETGFPPNFLASVDIRPPDLPWRFSIARPDAANRLNPWMVLVVVEEDGTAEFSANGGAVRLHLTADGVAGQLPDLAQSWAWAHVECRDGTPERARLLSPRRLEASTRYVAAVVPATAEGRKAGLNEDVPADAKLGPAWDVADPKEVNLPVYAHWSFETGAGGDFEAVCRRLEPADLSRLKERSVRIAYDRALRLTTDRRTFDFRGAAVPASAARARSATDTEIVGAFESAVFDRTAGDGSSEWDWSDDPVVGPPLYGQGVDGGDVSSKSWGREVNTDPACRAAAGIGAAAVRANDERWMVELWRAAGDVRALNAMVEQSRLNGHASRRWSARSGDLDPGEILNLSAPLMETAKRDGKSVSQRVGESDLPKGALGRNTLRALRPNGRLQRSAKRGKGAHAEIVRTLVSQTGKGKTKVLRYGEAPEAVGAYVDAGWLRNTVNAAQRAGASRSQLSRVEPPKKSAGRKSPPKTEPVDDLVDIARSALDAEGAIDAVVSRRLRLQGERAGAGSAAAVSVRGRIDEALVQSIVGLGPENLLPGISGLGMDRIAVLAPNPRYVAAAVLGANTEMRRELAWRGFPDARAQTVLRNFWSEGDPEFRPIEAWPAAASLSDIGRRAQPRGLLLLLVRGEVVRRFPAVNVRLVRASIANGKRTPTQKVIEPGIGVTVDPASRVFGFSSPGLNADVAVGDRTTGNPGWYLVFEQSRRDNRFGLQAEPHEAAVRSWDDLSWAHALGAAGNGGTRPFLDAEALPTAEIENDPAVWGRGSADFARILLRRPFRLFVHAETLLGR